MGIVQITSQCTRRILFIGVIALGIILGLFFVFRMDNLSPRPYVVDLTGDYTMIPLVTVGEHFPGLIGDFANLSTGIEMFALSGRPDGLGVLEQKNGHKLVYINHEFRAEVTSYLNDSSSEKVKGARVSLFQFDANWNPIGGKNLIDKILDGGQLYRLDLTTGQYINAEGEHFNGGNGLDKFCSGYLVPNGFMDLAGQANPIWFTAEEGGSASRGWAVFPDGTAMSLDGLGKYRKEQVLSAQNYRENNSETTIILSTEDSADGEMYLYRGQQTAQDPNGFFTGTLHVMRVKDFGGSIVAYETMTEGVPYTYEWVQVPQQLAMGDGDGLSNWVNSVNRSTNFRRLEDIHEDPRRPLTFYVTTTGHDSIPPGHSNPDNPLGKVYTFSLNPLDPIGDSTITLVLEGGEQTGVNYDNLTVDSWGNVLLQEDRVGESSAVMKSQMRYARILAYNIAKDQVTNLFELNQGAIDPWAANDYGKWESSGILELPGEHASSYLFSVQAHSLRDERFVEGGQLVLAHHGAI